MNRTVVDIDRELAFWRRAYRSEPEVSDYVCFVDLEPAIRVVIAGYMSTPEAEFEALEAELARDYEHARGVSILPWDDVRNICRRAFQRLQQTYGTQAPPVRT